MPIRIKKFYHPAEPPAGLSELPLTRLADDAERDVLQIVLDRNLKGRLAGDDAEVSEILESPAFRVVLDAMARSRADHMIMSFDMLRSIYESGETIASAVDALYEEYDTATSSAARTAIAEKLEKLYFQLELYYQLCQNIWHRCARTARRKLNRIQRERRHYFGSKQKYGDFKEGASKRIKNAW